MIIRSQMSLIMVIIGLEHLESFALELGKIAELDKLVENWKREDPFSVHTCTLYLYVPMLKLMNSSIYKY